MPRTALPAFPALFLAACGPALAQSAPPVPTMQRVEITAPSATSARRNDVALAIRVTREDIARFGDTSVAAILKRQPGIAVVNGEVRMRGLGTGYTQILIDGAATPPGFAIDSLAPSMIERIDVMRGGSAEFGAQAIAGTINIIMRKNHARPQRDLTAGAATRLGRTVNPSATLRWAGQREQLAWSLGVEAARADLYFDESTYETYRDPGARLIDSRVIHASGQFVTHKLSLAPRLNWKFGAGASLAWQATLDRSRMKAASCAAETVLQGASTPYPDNCFDTVMPATALRSDLAWSGPAGPGKLVAKAAVSRYTRQTDYVFQGRGGTSTLVRQVPSTALDHTTTWSGKYLVALGSDHSLGLGWDGGRTLRTEDRVQRDAAFGGLPVTVLDEDYEAIVDRMALFAQDEWNVTPRLQLYLGLRWEALRTDVRGRTMSAVDNRSSVFSPVAQLLWKLPGSDKDQGRDQLRLALSRTYKAPSMRLLVPRRYTNNNANSPTDPDFSGNPQLRPELAWGLDTGYETYFGKDGMVSVSAYARRVAGVTVWQLDPVSRPWISTPSNRGNAKVAGIEADTRFKPHRDLDVRANVGYNWSSLDAAPGPDNRLAGQVAWTFNAGLDYRASAAATFGVNLNLQFHGTVQIDERERSYRSPSRGLDLYALWKVSDKTRWRLSLSDTLQQDRITRRSYADASGVYERRFVETLPLVARLVLETSL